MKANWRPTGWHTSNDGGYVLRYTITLPAGIEAIVFRSRRGSPWRWRVGIDETSATGFRTWHEARRSCERRLRGHLQMALKTLGGRERAIFIEQD